MIIIVCAYAYIKVDVFFLKKDIDIMAAIQDDFYDEHYVFDHSKGMNFAFAFTAFDSETEDILDPSYGKLAFVRYEWGETEDGEYFYNLDEIPSHTCTKEELALDG